MYYDSHCHLDFEIFDEDRIQVFERYREQQLSGWMLAGVSQERWTLQRRVCQSQFGCVWAAGIHPEYVGQYDEEKWRDVLASFKEAFEGPHAARAVGEIGIHKTPKAPQIDLQITRLYEQLEVARRWEMPIIFHVVKGHEEILKVIRRFGALPAGGVIHGFTGGPDLADRYVKLGLHLGINGRWIHGGGRRVMETIKYAHIDRLLLESDAPDQAPNRGVRNESTSIFDGARLIAVQKQLTIDAVLVQCSNNARALFAHRRSEGD